MAGVNVCKGKKQKTKKGGLEMGIAAGMKDIVQDIVSSHDVRAAELGKSKDEVKEMLGSFHASHKKMGTQLRGDLAQDKAKVKSKVKAMRNGFQTEHKEMGTALRKDLAGHTQAVKGEVAEMRGKIRTSHKEMSTQLKESLAQGETERKEASAGLKRELTQGAATRKSDGKGMLSDFQRSRKQTGTQLRRALADYDRGIKSEVAGMRQETKADLKEARTTWQGMAHTMEAKRAGVKVPPKVEVPLAEKVEAPVAEEMEGPVAEEEMPELEAKLSLMVTLHPEGITLAGVAEKLDVAPIVLGRASRSLIKKGKIRKEDKLYFPVGTE